MKRFLAVMATLLLLVTMVVAPAAAQMTPSVTVSDQESDGMTVTVDEVVSDGPGFIVIHSDNNGAPGPVLGFAPVQDGTNSNVEVTLDEAVEDGAQLWAMLHTDDNTEGEYEFGTVEGADAPVQDENGDVVMQSFTVTVTGTADAEATPTAEGDTAEDEETGADAEATATEETDEGMAEAEAEATPEAAPETLPTTGSNGGSGTPMLALVAIVGGLLLLGGAFALRPRAR